MTNWNDKETKKSASRNIFSIITALVLLLQVFGIPGVRFADKELTSYEKAMAALPGWVNVYGNELSPTNSIVSNNFGESYNRSLAIDPLTDKPCIAWSDTTAGNVEIYFARWNGSTWTNSSGMALSPINGKVSNTGGGSWSPSLVIDSLGNPCISWEDNYTGNYDIYFTRWNGSEWVNSASVALTATNGNVSNNSGASANSSLALDATDNPCIAWEDDTATPSNYDIYYVRWNGLSWVNASGATLTATNGIIVTTTGQTMRPSLDIDSSSNPCIAFTDFTLASGEVYYARWNGSSWVNASGATLTATNGNVSNNPGDSYYPSLALDASDNPNITWNDDTTTPDNYDIYFSKWNGSRWANSAGVALTATNGNVCNNSGSSWNSSLALDATDNPCITWADSTPGNREIYFTRWNGSSWVNASGAALTSVNGNVSNNSGTSGQPSLQLDSTGKPCITWEDSTPGNREIYFTRWSDGMPQPTTNQWVNAANVPLTSTNGNVSNNSGYSAISNVVLDPVTGNPCISWHDNTPGNAEIFFARWNGTSWVNASGAALTSTNGNVSNNSGDSVDASLALDSSGKPCISWKDDTRGNAEIFFARWNGTSWVNASGVTLTSTNGNMSNYSKGGVSRLSLDSSGKPCISWHDTTPGNEEIYFARWNGTSWVNAAGATLTATNGNVSNNSGSSSFSYLALDTSGKPCISWKDDTPGNAEIYFARWNGTSWVNAAGATLTATNGNVSNNSGHSVRASLALESSGNPCISWHDDTTGFSDIYYAKWNGTSWVNAAGATLTATNGNVSNNSGSSCNSSLALDSTTGNPCISWEDRSKGGNTDIYFARWIGTSWVNAAGGTLAATNGVVIDNSPGSYNPFLLLDPTGNPCISWHDNTPGNAEIYFARWNGTPQQPQPANGIKEFIKEVDTNADDIFDDNLKPVSEGQILRYKLTVVFDKKGISGEISDIVPENTEYIGMENGYKKPFSTYSDGKEWEMVTSSNEPDNKYARRNGAYLRWNVNSNDGLRQEFVYKVKVMFGSIALNKDNNNKLQNNTAVMNDIGDQRFVKSFEGVFSSGESTLVTSYSGTAINPTLMLGFDITDPLPGQFWTIGVGMNVRWTPPNNSTKKDFLKFTLTIDNKKDSLIDTNEIAVSEGIKSIVVDRSKWENIFKDDKSIDATLTVLYWTYNNLNQVVEVTNSRKVVSLKLSKYPVLNHAAWADPFKTNYVDNRYPLIFINGVQPLWPGGETLLWDPLLGFLNMSPGDAESKLKLFKPYVFSYDSGDSLWGQANPKGIEQVGLKLKNEVLRLGLFDKDKGIQIIAHSMGGLVSRSFMREKYNDKYCGDYVTRLITLATPHLGANQKIATFGPFMFSKFIEDMQRYICIPGNPPMYYESRSPFLEKLNNPSNPDELFADKIVTFAATNDEVVEVDSAMFTNKKGEPQGNKYEEFKKVKGSMLKMLFTGLNFSNTEHIGICSDRVVMQEVKNSLMVPILKCDLSTQPGLVILDIIGKAFGHRQGKSSFRIVPVSTFIGNIPVVGSLFWSDKQITATLRPAEDKTNGSLGNFGNSITNENVLKSIISNFETGKFKVVIDIESNSFGSTTSEDMPSTNVVTIPDEFIKPISPSVSLSVWPSKSQLVKGEDVEFTIKARNTGTSELTNVDIISNIPRELEFVSSTIKGVMGKNKLRIQLGRLMPKETTMFKVVCKLDENINIPEESGLWLLYSANLSTGTNINTSASALVKYFTRKPSENLSMNIIWKGVNTKTNEAKVGNPIALTIDVNGGSMPYHLTIDWGDGSIKEKKTWNKMLDPKPVFNKTYDNPGEVQVSITCVDVYGKATSIQRTIQIK